MSKSGGSSGSTRVHVAMLRGINVSGHNRVAMKDLRALVEALPAKDVETYVQSGNVVFRSAANDPDRLADDIKAKIRSQLSLEVAVLVRTSTELDQVVSDNPWLTDDGDVSKLHVTFLASAPDAERVKAASAAAESAAPDGFRVLDREVYLHCPGGYGRTKLNNAFFERKLAVAATTRNWRTVTTLAEMAHG